MKLIKAVAIVPLILLLVSGCSAKHLSGSDLRNAISDTTVYKAGLGGNVYFSPNGKVLSDLYKSRNKEKFVANLVTSNNVEKNVEFTYGEGEYHVSDDIVSLFKPVDGSSKQIMFVNLKFFKIAEGEYLSCFKDDISECDKSNIWKFVKGDTYNYGSQ